ncbi:zeta toxin family protein [Streptomyces javensis]|uniref:UDP-N-acetylglucosamine kinase n=1 Tax=Streptomyces javensis TaxID=114698 RepID=A0ABS0R8V2_9ACTN|nr:zeta toxin family protein [Streptomyces javensis]MBI0313738.1 zeta toxin family protein [Streptomyces javensis]
MSERHVEPVVLSGEENREVLEGRVLPVWTKNAARQDRPVTVFVAGPPGSGKTTLADLVHAVLNRRGGAVRIGRDLYKAAHRHYAKLLDQDVRTAGVKVRPDTSRWQEAVEAHVRVNQFDAVVETALTDAAEFRTASAAYRKTGSRIEVIVLATPQALDQLGILKRFLTEALEGGGRYVSWENHDTCAKRLPPTLAAIEAERLADRITVLRRDGEVLYDNELTDGAWRRPAAADKAVLAGRSRPWTAQETVVFRRDLAQTDQRLHREALPADKRLAVQRDTERAAALAEPVRRIAQATAQPPGVDYYRLSAAEHQWIFDELIVPSYLSRIAPQEQPVVVYVMGQPGAGKTRTARLVQRALRGRRPTRIVGEDYKVSHPDYLRLLQESPRTAGARIRSDYRAWQAMAEAHVRARRGDMVIEIAPGSVDQFVASVAAARRDRYRAKMVVLGVRAADSRQGTAARYAEVSADGGPARFTTAAGHDACFRAVVEAVRHAEADALVDSIVVMRRDGTAAYHNELTAEGRWHRAPGAARALAAEQQRPYTPQEAAEFFAMHRRLRAALPQYRAELLDIAQLAQPLMPDRWRPRRITQPAAPTALPARPMGLG